MGLRKPSGPVVAALHDAVPDDARVQHRKMFGCPCLFADGNMFAGVVAEDIFLRLPDDLRDAMLKQPGAKPFEPLPGRGVMRQYACVPKTMFDDLDELRRWLNESMQYALSLPPKPKKKDKGKKAEPPPSETNPEETLETSYQELQESLASYLLQAIKDCSPDFFERLVVDVLIKMGYGGSRKEAGKAIGRTGDEGIDGIIKEDKLGLDIIYIQAKRWEANVGRPEIQKFAGALQGQRARKGIFITTSSFSKDALDYVKNIESKIILIDGERLAELMIEHNVGVSPVASYDVKKIDSDYFIED